MRVLFTVFPATAHVQPIVPLAWALQNAGHQVRVAIHPDAVDLVTSAGLAAVPVGPQDHLQHVIACNSDIDKLDMLDDALALDTASDERWEQQWLQLTRILSVFTPVLPDLVELARDWQPDLVLWDPFCVPAAVAATAVGAAHARILWGRDNIAWFRARSVERLAAGAEDPVRALMAPLLEPYGLPYTEELLLGQWTVDPMPPGLRLPVDLPYLPIRRVPYNGAAVLPSWVVARPAVPRVCLTLGVGGRGHQVFQESGVSFAELVEALSRLPIELVAAVDGKQRATVAEVPDNVHLIDYLPLNHLLPTCAAIVHHGGGGTFATAVAHRVPQCVIPMNFWNESAIGAYVVEHGAGIRIEPRELTAERLTRELTALLADPAHAAGAAALHRELLSTPGPAEVLPRLEELTKRHRTG
ncbi:nucleotide disphospho-sugar-binding domain-containing protein [Kitasatospora sp. NPDC094011]|uniref:nucleotide disphospho-sugar-binding domain-containing protein n=1 Tax=Kitasatospora sp. NPDC094011 TaxID=3364090 RepID=UPI00381990F4